MNKPLSRINTKSGRIILQSFIIMIILCITITLYLIERGKIDEKLNENFTYALMFSILPISSEKDVTIAMSNGEIYMQRMKSPGLSNARKHDNDLEISDSTAAKIWKKERLLKGNSDWLDFKKTDSSLKDKLEEIGLHTELVIIVKDSIGNIVSTYPDTISSRLSMTLKPIKIGFLGDYSIGGKYTLPLSYFIKRQQIALISLSIISILSIIVLNWLYKLENKRLELIKRQRETAFYFSQDIKIPVNTIKQILHSVNNISSERLCKYAKMTSDELNRVTDILEQMMLHVICGEKIFARKRATNITELIDTIISKEVESCSPNILITKNVEPNNLVFNVDAYHVEKAIKNIIKNSILYGKDDISISIDCFKYKKFLYIVISDNGFGIPNVDLKHVFEKAYRGENATTHYPGIGLGLYYVAMVAEAHKGSVKVCNSDYSGCTITMKLR